MKSLDFVQLVVVQVCTTPNGGRMFPLQHVFTSLMLTFVMNLSNFYRCKMEPQSWFHLYFPEHFLRDSQPLEIPVGNYLLPSLHYLLLDYLVY